MESCMRVVTSATESVCGPAASSVPQGSALGPFSFNSFISDLDEVMEHALSKFSDGARQGGMASTPEGSAVSQ